MRQVVGVGVIGVVGLGLLAFAASFELSANRSLRAQVLEAEQQGQSMAARAAAGLAPKRSDRQILDQFYADFPSRASLPDTLLALDKQARKHGLSPYKASYRELKESGTPLKRVRVDIPLRGDYAALRSWLDEVHVQMPLLAIESLQLRRADIKLGELEATVSFAVFMRADR